MPRAYNTRMDETGLKPLPQKFDYPWGAASMEGKRCACVHCGTEGAADFQVQAYPHRWVPHAFRVSADGSLACPVCAHNGDMFKEPPFTGQDTNGAYYFYRNYEVAVSADVHGTLSFTHKPLDTVAAPTTVPVGHSEDQMDTTDHEMSDQVEEPSKLKSQAKAAGKAVGLGVAMAAVNEGGDIMLDIAKAAAKDNPLIASLLESEDGREVAKFMVALGLQTAATHTNVIPKGQLVARVAEVQLAVSSFKLIGPRLKSMRGYLQALAKIGENLDDKSLNLLTDGSKTPTFEVEETSKSNGKRARAKVVK